MNLLGFISPLVALLVIVAVKAEDEFSWQCPSPLGPCEQEGEVCVGTGGPCELWNGAACTVQDIYIDCFCESGTWQCPVIDCPNCVPPPPPCSEDPVIGDQACEIEGQVCPGAMMEPGCLKFDGTRCYDPFEGMMTDCICEDNVWNCSDDWLSDEGLLEDGCRSDCSVCENLNLSLEDIESGTCSDAGQYCNGPPTVCEEWNGQTCAPYEIPRYCLCNGATWDCPENAECEPCDPNDPPSPWDDLGPACPFTTWDVSSESLIPLTISDLQCDTENLPLCYATDIPICDFAEDIICDSAPEFFCICDESGSWVCPFYEFGLFPDGNVSPEESPPATNQNEMPPACLFDSRNDSEPCVGSDSTRCEATRAWNVCESNEKQICSTVEITVQCLCGDEGVWSCPSDSELLASLGVPPEASVESKPDTNTSSENDVTTEAIPVEQPSAAPDEENTVVSSNLDATSSAMGISQGTLLEMGGLIVQVFFG